MAAQAEGLRLRRLARRVAVRAAFAAAAGVFLLAALAAVHVAVVLALACRMPPQYAVLWVAGGDVLLALILFLLARRASRPDRLERDASALRDQALAPLRARMVALREGADVGRLLLRTDGLWPRLSILLALVVGMLNPRKP
ncbi:MAG: hypothetical protein BGP12_20480 [Rhodospirillales bacterium 70-18]|nr:MAG: hypothetical protein BGP12_20480 [Rhodospirillales bacterium 70-18]